MENSDGVFYLVGLFTAGFSAIFFFTDRHGRTSRALSLCLMALAARLLLAPAELDGGSVAFSAAARLLEAITILALMDWPRRIAETLSRRIARAANGLFRAAQIVVLVYAGLSLGYLALDPVDATTTLPGAFRVRALEWAVFAPVLGTAILLAGIAILILLFARADPAESIRLRALMFAAPFLLMALVVKPANAPYWIAVGLLLVLFGSVRYLMVQGRRGQFMSQFLAPEVARLVRLKGVDEVLKRERRTVSAVFCDLRGFTAYSSAHDTEHVVNLLERYYAAVGAVAAAHGGTVKDHAGDGLLLLLGAPVAQSDHAARAVRLALALRAALQPLLVVEQLTVGIGVASGEATLGAIKGAGRLEYVAVGPAINLAARLCQRAEGGEVLIDTETHAELDAPAAAQFVARAPEAIKGVGEAVASYVLSR